jgi:hypothetical protein
MQFLVRNLAIKMFPNFPSYPINSTKPFLSDQGACILEEINFMNWQQKIQNEVNKKGLYDHVRRLRSDEERRLVRTRSPIVVTAHPTRSESKDYLLKPLKGSIVLFWAPKGSSLITTLEKAYATGDEGTLKQLSAEFTQQLEKRKILPLKVAFEKLLAAPMYFYLLYGNKTLVSNLALVDGIEYGAMGFAYNGGSLRDADFKIVEYYKACERAEYDTLIVKTPPDLSAIEKEAIAAVPDDQLDLNLGYSTVCGLGCIAIIAVGIALITGAGVNEVMRDQLEKITLSASQVEQLGKLSSARELLSMRREIFQKFGV